jgi:6-phosphogluconolactonase
VIEMTASATIKTGVTLQRHETAAKFAGAVADRLTTMLQSGLRERQSACFAVPGGTTPGPIFDNLAGRKLDWRHVSVTLTDERWVPVSSPDSNEALVRKHLLAGEAKAIRLIGLHTDADRPSAGIAEVTARLQSLALPFDAVLLGMGGDGHFASLFPTMPALPEGLAMENKALCMASDQPTNGQPRISLTLPLLLQSHIVVLAIKGKDKLQILEQAKTASPTKLPIAAILQQGQVPVDVHYTD